MSHNNKNTNDLDVFSEAVRSKLDNHQMPVDVDLWNSIQESILPKKRPNVQLWWWISSGSAAAIVFMIMFLHPNQDFKPAVAAKYDKKQPVEMIHENSTAYNQINTPDKFSPRKTILLRNVSSSKSLNAASSVNQSQATAVIVDQYSTSGSDDNIKTNVDINKQEQHNQKDSAYYKLPILISNILQHQDIAKLIEKEKKNGRHTKILKNEKKGQWLLTPALKFQNNWESQQVFVPSSYSTVSTIGTITTYNNSNPNNGNGPIVGNPATIPGYGFNSIAGPQTLSPINGLEPNKSVLDTVSITTKVFNPSQISKTHYWLPMSFGLKIRNEFSKKLSIESGLIYTYLQTDFVYIGIEESNASLSLHYLGIPLSLNFNIWENPKWEIYISGGGTVEKGLSSIYEQTLRNVNNTYFTNDKSNIKGFQLSANSAAGISYKIDSLLGVYFEPQFSYYFKNNQPLSIRTKEPLVINMQMGLRYKLDSKK